METVRRNGMNQGHMGRMRRDVGELQGKTSKEWPKVALVN